MSREKGFPPSFRWLCLLTLCALLAAPGARGQGPSAVPSTDLAAASRKGLAAVAPVPGQRSPKMDTVVARLAGVAALPIQAQQIADTSGLRLEAGLVQVQVAPSPGGAAPAARAIADLGGAVTGRLPDGSRLQAWVPLAALEALAARDEIAMIRAPALAHLADDVSPQAVSVTSQGVGVSMADAWHAAGYRGQGVTVGIVDLGFQQYLAAQSAGELPAAITLRNFVDGQPADNVAAVTPHGTACAEIVHDMAPDASLYLARIATDIDLGEAVTWLIAQGVDVISTSLGWYNLTPGDGSGHLAAMVNEARAAGITWVTAAGNMRQAHWGGPWLDTEHDGLGDGFLEFAENVEINYIDLGVGYMLPAGRMISVYVRWSDWTEIDQDFDLYLMRWNESLQQWETMASDGGTDPQTGHAGQTPTEHVSSITYGDPTNYGFAIQRISVTRTDIQFEAFVPEAAQVYAATAARSLFNLADAANALTVGAVQVSVPHTFEIYSSEGPTNGPGGLATGGSAKPDLVGYDGVATFTYPTFRGTSAAAPHVAGAAALVRGAYSTFSPDQVRDYLQGRAVDMGSAGVDTQYGYGRLLLGQIVPRAWLPIAWRQ